MISGLKNITEAERGNQSALLFRRMLTQLYFKKKKCLQDTINKRRSACRDIQRNAILGHAPPYKWRKSRLTTSTVTLTKTNSGILMRSELTIVATSFIFRTFIQEFNMPDVNHLSKSSVITKPLFSGFFFSIKFEILHFG